MLDNRELSLAMWSILFAAWAFSKAEIRKSSVHLLKTALKWQILLPIIAMVVYVALISRILSLIISWDISNIKTTIIWFFTSAIVMVFNIGQVSDDSRYFKKAILAGFKISVIIEFVGNMYVFNLFFELLFVPVMAMLGVMLAMAECKNEFKPFLPIFNSLLAILGLGLLDYFAYRVVTDSLSFFQIQTLADFLLPIVMTVLFLPFLYLLAAYASYETLFMRLGFLFKDVQLRRFAKIQSVRYFGYNLYGVERLAKCLARDCPATKEEIIASIQRSRYSGSVYKRA